MFGIFLKAKLKKYRVVFKAESREKTGEVWKSWSQQLEHKQVQKGWKVKMN